MELLRKPTFEQLVLFLQGVENGLPAYVCDPAASHHTGNFVHRNYGKGNSHNKENAPIHLFVQYIQLYVSCLISL